MVVWSGAVILFLAIKKSLLLNPPTIFMVAINKFASDVVQWPCSQYGKWGMKGTAVQGGQEDTIHPPTDLVDLYVDVVCHLECTIAHGGHIRLLRVLPHTTIQFQSVSCHTTCTKRLTW
jgi:hypothetical protein